MAKLVTMALSLLAIAVLLVLSGLYIRTLDSGSCPANSIRCYHTFPNTNIYITPAGNSIIEIGIALVAASVGLFLYSIVTRNRDQTKKSNQTAFPS